jgi:hypothetical protein
MIRLNYTASNWGTQTTETSLGNSNGGHPINSAFSALAGDGETLYCEVIMLTGTEASRYSLKSMMT